MTPTLTLPEAIEAAGPVLQRRERDGAPVLRGELPPEVVAVLRAHRDRVRAVLELRAIYAAMGFEPEDLLLLQRAHLAGKDVRIVALPPAGVVA